jgi:uncharacterized protein
VPDSLGDAARVRKALLIGLGLAAVAILSVASIAYLYSAQIQIDGVSHTLSTWRSQAEVGDRTAQYVVGIHYLQSGGGSEDITSGLSWIRKSANQSEPRAELQLGLAYRTGTGIEQNDAEAVRWLRFSAEQGNAEAAYNLGYIFETGLRLSPQDPLWSQMTAHVALPKDAETGEARKVKLRNPAEAARWYRMAIERGHTGAMLHLGTMYQEGRGVEKNGPEAMRLLQTAAKGVATKSDSTPPMAALNLALAYQKGDIAPQDDAAAAKWAEAALNSPGLQPLMEVAAAHMLADFYANGRGVPRDEEKARALQSRAAAAWQQMRRAQAIHP